MCIAAVNKKLGLVDATMVVVGVMIGSGIFIVPAAMTRVLPSAGWLLVAWCITGLLTVCAALSYGELAAMLPHTGGMYVYLKTAFSPAVGFLYGWTLFAVIQTGTIAAVAIACTRFLGVLIPGVNEQAYIISPTPILGPYAVSCSRIQLLAMVVIVLFAYINTLGVHAGAILQNTFTTTKVIGLLVVTITGVSGGGKAIHANFAHPWHFEHTSTINVSLASTGGIIAALCIAQAGSLFSADAWHDVTFMAGEVHRPARVLPLALGIGTLVVSVLYVLANISYLAMLPIVEMAHAPADRVATAMVQRVWPQYAAPIVAGVIVISTVGTLNALTMTGARVYYAMANDRLFFQAASRLNRRGVPATALAAQAVWASFLVLPRVARNGTYESLYSDLLEYVIAVALAFYVLTIVALFRLRKRWPTRRRPYRAIGYPIVPGIYLLGAVIILAFLIRYRPFTTWPGILLVLLGLPVYALRRGGRMKSTARLRVEH